MFRSLLLTLLVGLVSGCRGDVEAAPPASPAGDAARASGSAREADGADYLVDHVGELLRGEIDPTAVAYHCDFCERVVTHDDALAEAAEGGIVWYGLWEDAVAESRRTGKPLLIHFGSPRCMQVPGVW